MRKAGGYAIIQTPDPTPVNFDRWRCQEINSGTYEIDTFTCIHCGSVRHVTARMPMDDFGSMCRNCMKMVCPKCADGPCIPFEKKLEEAEKKDRFRRSLEF
jgi:hypothetical protein